MKSLNVIGWMGAAMVLPMGLAGCFGGKGSSQDPAGSNSSAMTKVSASSVTKGSVPACAPGHAHRNVCCVAGPNAPAECGVYESEPFRACDTGSKTYPDPTTCCDLKDPGSCEPPPPPVTIDAGPPVACGYACPPGWYASGGGCCSVDPNGNGVCYATVQGGVSVGVSSTGSSGPATGVNTSGPASPPTTVGGGCDPKIDPTCPPPPPPEDAGAGTPACDPTTGPCAPPPPPPIDAGTCDPTTDPSCCITTSPAQPPGPPILADGGTVCVGPVPTPPPPVPLPPPPCDLPCPDGWQQPIGEPDLCCETSPDGTIACFSQATGPGGIIGVGGGGVGGSVGGPVPVTGVATGK